MRTEDQLLGLVDPRLSSEPGFTGIQRRFIELVVQERWFLAILSACFVVAGATYNQPQIAMWVGFMFAGYAVIANDSIQTIGTFIASNKHRPWWVLWLFIGGVMVATIGSSYFMFDGDVTHGLLSSKGLAQAPTKFAFLQVAGPLFLLILTRLRMPVSTTFLILTSFATDTDAVGKVLGKSVSGYVLAFVVAITAWFVLGRWMDRKFKGEAHPAWCVGQWIATTLLWSMWLIQDAANVAVFLPRQLSFAQFAVFIGVLFLGLGILFKIGGDNIQQVVEEKAAVVDVRHATIIDTVYGTILLVFKIISNIPMSTTWVFIGLLAGREIAINITRAKQERRTRREVSRLILKDLGYATLGLIISLVIAVAVNPALGHNLFGR